MSRAKDIEEVDKVDEYIGIDFVAAEPTGPNTSGDDKAGYYPTPEVVQIRLRKIPHEPGNPDEKAEQIVKADVIAGRAQWAGAEAFEDAHFYIQGDILVSDPIPVDLGDDRALTFTEVIELGEQDGDLKMVHKLLWSDGDFGKWDCDQNGGG